MAVSSRFADLPPTTIHDWARSDEYHNSFLIPKDPAIDYAIHKSKEHGLPDISVTEAQGKLLNLLARSLGAKRILEVGTLGGYSTIWLGRALPEDGHLTTLEISEAHAKVAEGNIANAGLTNKVTVKVGPAAETLKTLSPNPPFDLAFIDADKSGNLTYFLEAKRLLSKGGVIIVDNVVRNATVADPGVSDENIEGVRALLEHLKADKEVDATTIATVGGKGYDGFLYALKL
ncbi:O-methyltransferase family 3 protein [Rickenella mellea]|uniref:O-methyltransferase family 3 protein n=1 Tax=Rickenella mellea TaxID=50990 RepID=A0A4Y7QJZ6_9AGAM|nr:O-methyltransferase family 3 protein [Rickenella mellea]